MEIYVQNLLTNGGNDAPNQFVIWSGGEVHFQSYSTHIASFKDGVLELTRYWDCSRTTMKYFAQWLEEYTPFVYGGAKDFRKAIESNEKIVLK